jgi:hypothetical protein
MFHQPSTINKSYPTIALTNTKSLFQKRLAGQKNNGWTPASAISF